MSRKEEITEQIRALTVELDGIEKVWPQEGDEYWTPRIDGSVEDFRFHNSNWHSRIRIRGLCFKTEEQATTYRDNDNLYTELRQALKDANGDWLADWEDNKQIKYYISGYNYNCKEVVITTTHWIGNNKYVANSRDILLTLIYKYGKRQVCRAFGIIE